MPSWLASLAPRDCLRSSPRLFSSLPGRTSPVCCSDRPNPPRPSPGWLLPCWALIRAAGIAPPPNLSPDAEALLWLGLTGTFSTALGGLLWNIGVSRVGLAAGVLWQNTVPVFGVLISMMFGFVPTAGQVLGGALVLAGVLVMQWHRLRG